MQRRGASTAWHAHPCCGKVLSGAGDPGEGAAVNKNTFLLAAALALASVLAAFPAQAQKKMYRCGSNYQDRPCDQAQAAPKPAAAAPVKAETAPAPQSRAAYQQQLRCENYGRQMDELRDKQNAMKTNVLDGQIRSLETRMKADSC